MKKERVDELLGDYQRPSSKTLPRRRKEHKIKGTKEVSDEER